MNYRNWCIFVCICPYHLLAIYMYDKKKMWEFWVDFCFVFSSHSHLFALVDTLMIESFSDWKKSSLSHLQLKWKSSLSWFKNSEILPYKVFFFRKLYLFWCGWQIIFFLKLPQISLNSLLNAIIFLNHFTFSFFLNAWDFLKNIPSTFYLIISLMFALQFLWMRSMEQHVEHESKFIGIFLYRE